MRGWREVTERKEMEERGIREGERVREREMEGEVGEMGRRQG